MQHHAAYYQRMVTTSEDARARGIHAIGRREAALRLNVCLKTLDRMVKRGDIKAVRYGGRTMIPSYELDRLLDAPIKHAPSLTHQETIDHDQEPRIYGHDH